MPDLRAGESSLRGRPDAPGAQLTDRAAHLGLAGDLEGFLTQLRESAGTPERRHVLRLLVKDVRIGPEKITIRHRRPVRGHQRIILFAPAAGPRTRAVPTVNPRWARHLSPPWAPAALRSS